MDIAPQSNLAFLAVLALLALIGAALLVVWLARRFLVRVPPGSAAVLTGRSHEMVDARTGAQVQRGYRIVTSGWTMRTPLLERVDYLPISTMEISTELDDLRDSVGRTAATQVAVECQIASELPNLDLAVREFLTMESSEIEAVCETIVVHRVTEQFTALDIHSDVDWHSVQDQIARLVDADFREVGITLESLTIKPPSNYKFQILTSNGRNLLPEL